MRPRFPSSLQAKLLAVILLTTVVALAVALCAMVAYDLRLYQSKSVSELRTQAELLGQTSAAALQFDDPKVAQENLQLLRFRSEIQAAAIYDASGRIFAKYAANARQDRFPAQPAASGARTEGRDLYLFKQIEDQGQIVGTVYLRADNELYGRVVDYAGIAAMVALAAMLVAVLTSARMQTIVTRPILAIAAVARHIVTTRDYSVRARKTTDDEVGMLAEAFNDMLGEIQQRALDLEREVAERRHREQEIARLNAELEDRVRERTAELQEANKDLEAFTFSVSHDLRAPLRAVDGYCGIISEDYADRLDEKGKRLLAVVRDSGQRMSKLIEALLAFSRSARQQIQAAQVDMARLAEQAWAEACAAEPAGSAQFIVRSMPVAQGDAALLMQVWVNLITNARKYSGKRQQPIIEVGGEQRGAETVYWVKDNGVGFDMRHYQKLFAVFQRLHSASEFPGSGVGLAIVQRIVTRHGGRVWAEGKVDEGATFFFSLPSD